MKTKKINYIYSQTGQCAAINFLLPNAQKLFNKQTKKKKKNYSRIYLISFISISIKMKRMQVFFEIKLHFFQTASFFLTFNFALQFANFTYIIKYTECLI